MRADVAASLLCVSLLGVLGAGCGAGNREVLRLSLQERLQHEDPDVRLRAILEAGRTRDAKSLPFLVDRLSDSETEVRVFASIALEKIAGSATSRRMGYCHFAAPPRRAAAIRRWRAWLASGRPTRASSRPATMGAS